LKAKERGNYQPYIFWYYPSVHIVQSGATIGH
jgi:hypothetical protein